MARREPLAVALPPALPRSQIGLLHAPWALGVEWCCVARGDDQLVVGGAPGPRVWVVHVLDQQCEVKDAPLPMPNPLLQLRARLVMPGHPPVLEAGAIDVIIAAREQVKACVGALDDLAVLGGQSG